MHIRQKNKTQLKTFLKLIATYGVVLTHRNFFPEIVRRLFALRTFPFSAYRQPKRDTTLTKPTTPTPKRLESTERLNSF